MNAWQWFQKTYCHVLMFHVPNGELRHIRVAERLKRMGVVPGIADFLAFPLDGRKIAIEMKTTEPGSRQEKEQRAFEKHWEATGGTYIIVGTLEYFKQVCEEQFGPSFASLVLR